MWLDDELQRGWPPSGCKIGQRVGPLSKAASAATAPGLDIGPLQKPPEMLAGHALGDNHCKVLSLLVYAPYGLIKFLEGILLCHGDVMSKQETLQT